MRIVGGDGGAYTTGSLVLLDLCVSSLRLYLLFSVSSLVLEAWCLGL